MEIFLEPFTYHYMARAIWVCALVGGVCAFLSCYLILKGWSLMGDALAHSVVPGVALAYILALPYAVGAFFAGLLAALAMATVRQKTKLREDAVIGLIFSGFFALGLLMVSVYPTSVNLQAVILGNILAVSDEDVMQVVIICVVCLGFLLFKHKDLTAVFFDADHAHSIGMPVTGLYILFFTMLSATAVAALQTVGACLVIAMVITPGATAYLLTDRFDRMIVISVLIGVITGAGGAYASYFMDANTGGLIVVLQTVIFLSIFVAAPKHGLITRMRQSKMARG